MRKQTKTATPKRATSIRSMSYHGLGGDISANSANYAFNGFTKNLYFTSDRTKELDANFRLEDGSPLKGYGLEIELECSRITDNNTLAFTLKNLAFANLPANLFKFQNDGSLRGQSSTEAITQVMTKEFIRNNLGGFKYAYEVFKILGVAASTNCGMHCNMSVGLFGKDDKNRKEAIRKFIYLVNHHYGLACHLVKRSPTTTGFCSRMPAFLDKNYCKTFDLDAYGDEGHSSHHVCFNYGHFNAGRVELRLVGGQPDYYAFRNTMEVIFHLVDAVKRLSWDALDDVRKVFAGCNKYVLKRLADCVANYAMTASDYEAIKEASDTETDFGNF